MINWKQKLTSRKLWVSITTFVAGLLIYCGKTAEEAESIVALIMSGAALVAYIIAEGLVDANRPPDSEHPPDAE